MYLQEVTMSIDASFTAGITAKIKYKLINSYQNLIKSHLQIYKIFYLVRTNQRYDWERRYIVSY